MGRAVAIIANPMTIQPRDPEQTDPSLLGRIRHGASDPAWFEFDALYRPMLRRFALSYGASDSDADDVVQYCMTAIYMHIDGFAYDPQRGRFKNWLRTLVKNRCRDAFRAGRAKAEGTDRLEVTPADDDSPEQVFDKIWIEEHLKHCVQRLRKEVDAPMFEAFQRYVLDGEDAERVTESLGVSPNQLYKIKHRLTKRLRVLMAPLVGEEFSLASSLGNAPRDDGSQRADGRG